MDAMIWGLAVAVVILGSLGVLLWLGAREHRGTKRDLEEIDSLPEAKARTIALELLARRDLFTSKLATETLTNPSLPASVREVLERYEEIVRDEFWVGRAALSQSTRRAGFTKIGEDEEFEEILVRPGDERIHLSFGHVPNNEPTETVPTLWHQLIIVSGVKLHGG
jgi:hypothetical protein